LYGGQYNLSPKNMGNVGNKSSNTKSNIFPYNKLDNNPTSKFIAYTIKKSEGGFTGNDNEAYAEAAFNSIKTPQKYSEVAKYLGEDPYNFISGFMDTKTRYHLNPVYTHYVELYNSNPDDRPKVSKPTNVKDFQLWVLNTKKDKQILGKYGADGDWGSSSIKAWYKYGNEYLKSSNNNNDNVVDVKSTEWLKNTSNQVKKQIEYLMSTKFKEPFTLLDDKNSIVYSVNEDYSLHNSYKVITGRDRGDEVKDVTFSEWFFENPLDNFWTGVKAFYEGKWGEKLKDAVKELDDAFLGTKLWVTRSTPSGIFKADSGVRNWLQDKILTLFAEKVYGKRFIGFKTLDGDQLAVGFHGTKNPERIIIDKDDWTKKTKVRKGNISFGCINFKDSDIQDISNFITNNQFTFWLPDLTNDIVKFK
jgi:hypothetical protein